MTPTHGRGEYSAATFVWRWRADALHARPIAHRLPVGFVPRWLAVVPELEPRPEWVPASAHAYALDGGDVGYVW